MAEIGISEAARLVGKTRNTLYRFMKDGKLSYHSGESGARTVDVSELLRVFPYAAKAIGESYKCDTSSDTNMTESDSNVTGSDSNITPDTQGKDEVIQLLKAQLAEAAKREAWLKERIEALEKRLPLPPGQGDQAASQPEKPKGFWARLFGFR